LAARLVIEGATRAHAALAEDRERVVNQLRSFSLDWLDELWLEKIELHTRPALAVDELRGSEGFVGELLRSVAEARHDPALLASLRAELQPLVDKLGEELSATGEVLDVATLLDEVEAHLVAALVTS
jgi:hypothetical protein